MKPENTNDKRQTSNETSICRSIYRSKKMAGITYDVFEEWYAQKKCCEYCELTEEDSKLLFENFPEATRGGRRGRRLELDRMDPVLAYDINISNLALACYWCNNAKTNYFSFNEFKLIGPSIGAANRKRLESLKAIKITKIGLAISLKSLTF